MKKLFVRWIREFTECLPVCIWLVIGALISGAVFALSIQSIKMLAPQWLENTPFAGGVLAEGAPIGAIVVFFSISIVLALAMLFLPTMRRYAFLLASALLSSSYIKPAHGLRAALLGALWNIIHFLLGSALCILALYILPIGFGAFAQVIGFEQSLTAVSLYVSQPVSFLLTLVFFAFIIFMPYLVNRLARWLRLLARYLMIGERVEFEPNRNYSAHLQVNENAEPNQANGASNVMRLSSREREIIVLVAEGLRNREIAERLFIAPETVKSHISSILTKLEAENRTQAVSKALQIGLLEIETRE